MRKSFKNGKCGFTLFFQLFRRRFQDPEHRGSHLLFIGGLDERSEHRRGEDVPDSAGVCGNDGASGGDSFQDDKPEGFFER